VCVWGGGEGGWVVGWVLERRETGSAYMYIFWKSKGAQLNTVT
jgi:hypothetical protein